MLPFVTDFVYNFLIGFEGVRFGDLRIRTLLFADGVVLLASSVDRWISLQPGGMRISTSKSEAMVLGQINWRALSGSGRRGLGSGLTLGSIYQSIFVPTPTYGHELWVAIKKTRLRVQAIHRVAGLSLRKGVRSSAIIEELGIESLLFHAERSQMRWFAW